MQRFLDALSKGVFAVARCRYCSSTVWPPSPVCRRCLNSDMEWVYIDPSKDEIKGRIMAVSESYIRGVRFAFIELENGARLFGRVLEDDNPETEPSIGSLVMMVRCGIDDDNEPYYLFKSLQASTSKT